MLNDLQVEFGMGPATEELEAKCSTAAFPKLFMLREVESQVPLVAMSRPSPRDVAPPPCLPLDIKDLLQKDPRFFDGGLLVGWLWAACEAAAATDTAAVGCCASPPEQLSAPRTLSIGFKKAMLKKS
jgi:hypothetical protein